MSPDETAEKILEGVLGRKSMRFSQFRQAMIEEHPEYLDDDQIHDLFMEHVVDHDEVPPDPSGKSALLRKFAEENPDLRINTTAIYAATKPEEIFGPLVADEIGVERATWPPRVCHPDCTLGPDADHPGYLEYRCIDDQVRPLPFPGEEIHKAIDSIVEWADKNRPTEEEFRRVAYRKPAPTPQGFLSKVKRKRRKKSRRRHG